jgi:NADPH:quinone reductase-like Zn-dependent oxidoreductase
MGATGGLGHLALQIGANGMGYEMIVSVHCSEVHTFPILLLTEY